MYEISCLQLIKEKILSFPRKIKYERYIIFQDFPSALKLLTSQHIESMKRYRKRTAEQT